MTRRQHTMDTAYFENLYASDPDPWRFATSAYEREKYAATLAALPQAHYGAGLEIGCSIGILTRQLAAQVKTLLSVDIAAGALDQARERCGDLQNVAFAQLCVPADWPEGRYDLVLLSEVIYYLEEQDVVRLAARIGDSVTSSADIVLVHWLGETDYPLKGDEAADLFIAKSAGFATPTRGVRTKDYRLDVLRVGAS